METVNIPSYTYSPMIVIDEQEIATQAAKKANVKFKGEVEQNKIRFPAELGEEHPFNSKVVEGIWRKFGMIREMDF